MANPWQSDQSGWFATGAGNSWDQQNFSNQQQQYYNPNQESNFYPTPSQQPAYPQDYYAGQQPSYAGDMFFPQQYGKQGMDKDIPFEDELPLLEELGINFDHIRQKTWAVLNPLRKPDAGVISDQDLAGPLVFCLLFGFSLLLHGKIHFGYIYGLGVLGSLGMYSLLNLLAPDGISLTCTVSVLGYCLLPMGLLSLLAAVLSFKGVIGLVVAVMAVLWCSLSAAKLFVIALSMDHQQLLVAYPCCLVYGVFALLAIF